MANVDFTLLKTKLVPQRTRSQLIERPRLLSYLANQTAQAKLIAVYAPAGFGKSTLISQYIQREQDSLSAWYSLDDDDNNLDVFTQYFIAAYELASHTEKEVSSWDHSARNSSANSKAHLTVLFNEIASSGNKVRFVLDDFHLITNPRVLETIDWVLKSMPDEMTLVLTSRERPNLECLPDLRMQGCAVEIGAKQLKLTIDETEHFVSTHPGIDLDRASLDILYERTEGWVAATQLALHALQDQSDQTEFVKRFSGSDKDIVNYLGAMVLRQQSEEVQKFFLYTSILKRLSGALCEEVTGNKNAAALLTQISNDGLFLFELDREQTWFRYHHLFGEFLLSRFKANYPEAYKQTALKAATWCLNEKELYEAIHYYLMAEEFDVAVNLMSEHVSELVQYHGQHEVLLRWVEKLPPDLVQSHAELSICYAWSLIFTRSLDGIETVLDEIREHHVVGIGDIESRDWVQWNLEMLSAMNDEMRGNAIVARLKTDQWLKDWPNAHAFERGVVLGVNGASGLQTLDLKMARKVIREATQEFSSCDAEYGLAWMSYMYALVLLKQGQFNESKQLLTRALKSADEKMGSLSLGSALLHLGLADVCYQRNELKEASVHIGQGYLSIEEHGHVETIHLAFLTKARLLLREDKKSEALATLYEAEAFGRRLNLAHYVTPIAVERLRILLLEGQVDEARALMVEYGFDELEARVSDFTAFERLLISTLELRIEFAEQMYDELISRSAEQLVHCEKQGMALEILRIGFIQLRAYYEKGQTNKAFRLLNKYVDKAAGEQQISVFIEEHYYLAPLWPDFFRRFDKPLATLKSGQESATRQFVSQLREEIRKRHPELERTEDVSTEESVVKESLSKKERQILSYLDQGLSNKELSETLFVSVSTIKWHLTHIYAKLGVKNRVEAIKAFQQNHL